MKQENTTSNATVTPIVQDPKKPGEYENILEIFSLTGSLPTETSYLFKIDKHEGYIEYLLYTNDGKSELTILEDKALIIETRNIYEETITHLECVNSKWVVSKPKERVKFRPKELSKRASM